MTSDIGTITFSIPEAFDDAVHSIRAAIAKRGLRIASELDLSKRVKRRLGIRLPPCRILYVWPRLPARDVYPMAAVVLPLHIVVASHGSQTDILVPSRIRCDPSDMSGVIRSTLMDIQTEIFQALETIAMRPCFV